MTPLMLPAHSQLKTEPELLAWLQQHLPGLRGVYAFGSRCRGDQLPDSDLDLAVVGPGQFDPVALWWTAQDLAIAVGCDVDLVDFLAAPTQLQYRILTTGRRLWSRDLQVELYELFVFNEKLRLDEKLAPLIADIEQRGQVYDR